MWISGYNSSWGSLLQGKQPKKFRIFQLVLVEMDDL
jgi:hypothetical protein